MYMENLPAEFLGDLQLQLSHTTINLQCTRLN